MSRSDCRGAQQVPGRRPLAVFTEATEEHAMSPLMILIIVWSILAIAFVGAVVWALTRERIERKRAGKEGFPHTRVPLDEEKKATSH